MVGPDPIDIGLVDPVIKLPFSQPFPQIPAPFVNPATGVINQTWLQLLIALWNRTGFAPGASTPDAIAYATLDDVAQTRSDFSEALAVANADRGELALDSALEAVLMLSEGRASTSADAATDWCMPVVAAPLGLIITTEACGTLFTNEL